MKAYLIRFRDEVKEIWLILKVKLALFSAPIKCNHLHSSHFVLDHYSVTPWKDCGDNHRETCNGDLKVKCLNCNEVFLKQKQFLFRDKFTKEFLY